MNKHFSFRWHNLTCSLNFLLLYHGHSMDLRTKKSMHWKSLSPLILKNQPLRVFITFHPFEGYSWTMPWAPLPLLNELQPSRKPEKNSPNLRRSKRWKNSDFCQCFEAENVMGCRNFIRRVPQMMPILSRCSLAVVPKLCVAVSQNGSI